VLQRGGVFQRPVAAGSHTCRAFLDRRHGFTPRPVCRYSPAARRQRVVQMSFGPFRYLPPARRAIPTRKTNP
jgi:hypothetical protein